MHASITDIQHRSYESSAWRAWVVVLTAGLFFFYEFIQMNMFDAISVPLMHEFAVDAAKLGELSSYYFVANVLFLFPAGVLLDRYSTRWIIVISMSFCVLGTLCLSFATTFDWAIASRFLTGIGSAFCFLSSIRLASRWLEPKHMALATGLLVTMAMLGGMLAQTPMTIVAHMLTWRRTLLFDAALGVALMAFIFSVVRDYPPGANEIKQLEAEEAEQLGFWHAIQQSFTRWQTWLAGFYTCLMNLPLGLLGGLYGAMYVHQAKGISSLHATNVISMLFLGTIIGAPLMGWFSDHIERRRGPMLFAAAASCLVMAVIVFGHVTAYWSLLSLFLALGFFTSGQVLSYPWVAESSLTAITAMSVSVVNISVQGGQAIFQPIFGGLLDYFTPATLGAAKLYTASAFQSALLLPLVGFVVAFVAAFVLKETYCRHLEDREDGKL